jgi:AcrR family transcriptional regulator
MVERREEPDRVVEILDAACRVIARDGWTGLRMDAVAREAGISKALVHYYFSTRKSLLRAAFGHSENLANARIEAEIGALDDPAERLEQFLLLVLADDAVYAENRALWSEVWSGMRLDGEIRPDVELRYSVWIDRLQQLIVEQWGLEEPDAEATRRAAWRLAAALDGIEGLMLLGLVDRATAESLLRESIALELPVPAVSLEER